MTLLRFAILLSSILRWEDHTVLLREVDPKRVGASFDFDTFVDVGGFGDIVGIQYYLVSEDEYGSNPPRYVPCSVKKQHGDFRGYFAQSAKSKRLLEVRITEREVRTFIKLYKEGLTDKNPFSRLGDPFVPPIWDWMKGSEADAG